MHTGACGLLCLCQHMSHMSESSLECLELEHVSGCLSKEESFVLLLDSVAAGQAAARADLPGQHGKCST
eukprot:1473376-Prymnesium_polylepis.3